MTEATEGMVRTEVGLICLSVELRLTQGNKKKHTNVQACWNSCYIFWIVFVYNLKCTASWSLPKDADAIWLFLIAIYDKTHSITRGHALNLYTRHIRVEVVIVGMLIGNVFGSIPVWTSFFLFRYFHFTFTDEAELQTNS